MPFETLSGIPASIIAGEVVVWAETLSEYPGASYALSYKFAGTTPQDGFQQFSISGTESGSATYTFTTLTTYKPGTYQWEKQLVRSSDSAMAVIARGTLTIAANLAATPTTTFAASQVALLKTALAALNTTSNQSVSFNGQSYSKANISDYNKQLVYWQAQVIAEQAKIDALAGMQSGRIRTVFMPVDP